jgi:hypothetical protein
LLFSGQHNGCAPDSASERSPSASPYARADGAPLPPARGARKNDRTSTAESGRPLPQCRSSCNTVATTCLSSWLHLRNSRSLAPGSLDACSVLGSGSDGATPLAGLVVPQLEPYPRWRGLRVPYSRQRSRPDRRLGSTGSDVLSPTRVPNRRSAGSAERRFRRGQRRNSDAAWRPRARRSGPALGSPIERTRGRLCAPPIGIHRGEFLSPERMDCLVADHERWPHLLAR